MLRQSARRHAALASGVLAFAAFLAAISLMPRDWRSILRETAIDFVLGADRRIRHSKTAGVPLAIVDIDRRSLEALGPWPWPRDTIAQLVEAVADGRPAVVAIDILFAEADTRSPAAIARQLGSLTKNADIASLAATLPDGDKRLSDAIRIVPVALGFVLDSRGSNPVPGVPVLVRGGSEAIEDVWHMSAGTAPASPLVKAVAGLGALSLPGDADGAVRRVPLFVGIGQKLRPGLALEAVRLLSHSSSYIIESDAQLLAVGHQKIPLPRDGLLRLAPVDPRSRDARTISAVDVIADRATRNKLAGVVAFIGGSAPELGGLRETPGDPLVASVQLQADAVQQIVTQRVPLGLPFLQEILLTFVLGGIGLVAAVALSPILGASVVVIAIAATWFAAVLLSVASDRLFDPLIPSLGAFAVFATTSVGSYAFVAQREARIRSRFEQHLSPAVVRRIAEEPGILKLSGERREVTALFTDIEGFTAMTHRAEPEQLVAVLDGYIEGVTTIVMPMGEWSTRSSAIPCTPCSMRRSTSPIIHGEPLTAPWKFAPGPGPISRVRRQRPLALAEPGSASRPDLRSSATSGSGPNSTIRPTAMPLIRPRVWKQRTSNLARRFALGRLRRRAARPHFSGHSASSSCAVWTRRLPSPNPGLPERQQAGVIATSPRIWRWNPSRR